MQNTAKQNYPGLVASYNTPQGNEAGLLYNAPKPTRGDWCNTPSHLNLSLGWYYKKLNRTTSQNNDQILNNDARNY